MRNSRNVPENISWGHSSHAERLRVALLARPREAEKYCGIANSMGLPGASARRIVSREENRGELSAR